MPKKNNKVSKFLSNNEEPVSERVSESEHEPVSERVSEHEPVAILVNDNLPLKTRH